MGAWADAKKIIERTEREADERRRRATGRAPENDVSGVRGDAPGDATCGTTGEPAGGTTGEPAGTTAGDAEDGHRAAPGAVPAARAGERAEPCAVPAAGGGRRVPA